MLVLGREDTRRATNLDSRSAVGVEDARAYWSQKLFDWNAVEKLRASQKSLRASDYSYKNSRDLVILVVANAYLQVLSDRATVESQQAQLETSRALYQRALDQTKAGVAARIDELRANVELQTQQQRLIAAQDQQAKDFLSLARAIGLPPGQDFTLNSFEVPPLVQGTSWSMPVSVSAVPGQSLPAGLLVNVANQLPPGVPALPATQLIA